MELLPPAGLPTTLEVAVIVQKSHLVVCPAAATLSGMTDARFVCGTLISSQLLLPLGLLSSSGRWSGTPAVVLGGTRLRFEPRDIDRVRG